ncbi:hypothetical protein B0T20DRAFT_511760 [Sordaria brevicollis]|uniref:Uncharacterized protein n=1 Tax=Sordaria brevicollis TaxID=83679 RepID=A0AAE0U0Q5_SORBR|nr:hypothetical protein B0T20DRAFT_511760 [Sordaria brevicollis]
MVNYRFLTLAALALPFAAAAPTVEALDTRQTEIFSFEKWVNSIIVNPETALTPEQAVEAWEVSTKNGTISSGSSLSKRYVSCTTAVGPTTAQDAAIVVNKLAALGAQACVSYTSTFFMTYGQAQCVGVVSSPPYPVTTTCQKVAQTGGLIMDQCTKSNGVTGGQASNVANSRMIVHLGFPL